MKQGFNANIFFLVLFAFILCAFATYLLFSHRSEQNVPSGAKLCLAEMEYCQSLIRSYVLKNGELPNSLTNVDVPSGKFLCPVSGLPYIYIVVTNGGHPEFYMLDAHSHDGGYLIASNFAYPVRINEDQYIAFTNHIFVGTK
jgi:hypothetical protein